MTNCSIDAAKSDLKTGNVVISESAVVGSKATLKATTYNGLSATCLIVYGVTSGGSVGPNPPTPPTSDDLIPVSIALELMGQPLEADKAMVISEKDTLEPVVVVKNKEGVNITKDAKPTWTSTDTNNCVTLDPNTGKLVAEKHTVNPVTNANSTNEQITVTATVQVPAVGETPASTLSVSYKINIRPVMSEDHFDLVSTANQSVENMIRGDSVDVKFSYDSVVTATGVPTLRNLTVKALNDNVTVAGTTYQQWKITAAKVGTAQIEIKANIDGVDYTKTKEIVVRDVPTADEITFTQGVDPATNTMTIGQGETAMFVVSLGEDFKGSLADHVTAKAYALEKNAKGEDVEIKDNAKVVVAPKTSFATGETVPNGAAFTVTGKSLEEYPKFRVVVTVYDNAKKEFTVEVKDGIATGKDIKIETTPKWDSDSTKQIDIGVGETVTLTATTNKTWSSGIKWIITSAVATADADKIKLEDKGNGVAEFTYTKAITNQQTVTVKAVRGGTTGNDAGLTGTQVTINVRPQPTKDNVTGTTIQAKYLDAEKTTAGDTSTIVLGVNEKVTAKVNFSSGCYTNKVFWETNSTGVIAINPYATRPIAEITGLTSTGTGTIELTAYAGTDNTGLKLATIKVQVLDAPDTNSVKLMDSTGATAFKFTTTWNSLGTGIDVKLNLDAKVSGTFKLSTRSSKVKVEQKASTKNVWTISKKSQDPSLTEDLIVTLTLTSEDNDFVKNYTLTVKK